MIKNIRGLKRNHLYIFFLCITREELFINYSPRQVLDKYLLTLKYLRRPLMDCGFQRDVPQQALWHNNHLHWWNLLVGQVACLGLIVFTEKF